VANAKHGISSSTADGVRWLTAVLPLSLADGRRCKPGFRVFSSKQTRQPLCIPDGEQQSIWQGVAAHCHVVCSCST
jgi:hypothetical protein